MSGLHRIYRALAPPIDLGDPAASLVAAIVDLVLVATLGFSAFVVVGPAPAPPLYALTLPVGLGLLGLLRWLVRKGRVRVAASLLCFGGFAVVATDLPIHGPNTVSVGAFILLSVIAGLTVGPASALSLAGATIAVLATVLLRGESHAYAPIPDPVRWVHYTTQLSLSAVVVAWWAMRSRKLLRELRASQERYSRLIEASPDAIVTLDPAGIVTFCNGAAETMFGHDRSAYVGRRWDQGPGIPPSELEQFRANFESSLHESPLPEHEIVLLHRDGRRIPVEVKSVPLHEDGRVVGILSMLRDISARKQAEAERASLERQLLAAQRMEGVGRFAGGIAHDFNNILTIIANATEVIREGGPDGSREAVSDVQEAASRGAALTRQLLAYSSRQPAEPRPTDVNRSVAALRPMFERLLGKHVAVALEVDTSSSPLVHIDPAQLDQVLLNLVVNARDAMPNGGIIRVTTRAEPADSRGKVRIDVSDTGSGMDPSTLARAFDPFFTTKGEHGTGLGLSVVGSIVHHAGGSIRCDSEPGRGTTFRIELPIVALS